MGSRCTSALRNRSGRSRSSETKQLSDLPSASDSIFISGRHPVSLDEEQLVRQCELKTGRVSGPGGQHRNRVETAVFVTHNPTKVDAQGTERRSQVENRRVAIRRLRIRLAVLVRTIEVTAEHQPSALWQSRRRDRRIQVSIDHWDYAIVLVEALDLVTALNFDVSAAAATLGVSMSQLTRLIRQDKFAAAKLNAGRKSAGLGPLRD